MHIEVDANEHGIVILKVRETQKLINVDKKLIKEARAGVPRLGDRNKRKGINENNLKYV